MFVGRVGTYRKKYKQKREECYTLMKKRGRGKLKCWVEYESNERILEEGDV